MAAFTFGPGHPFPVGTTVQAYDDKGQNASGQPSGTPVASGVVGGTGSLAITGLTEGKRYWAVAQVNGDWKWVQIYAQREPEFDPGSPLQPFDERLDSLEGGGPWLLEQAIPSDQHPSYVSPAGSRVAEFKTDTGDVFFGESTLDNFWDFRYRANARRMWVRSLFLNEVADAVDLTQGRAGQPSATVNGAQALPLAGGVLTVVSTGAIATAFDTSKTIEVEGRSFSFTGITATTFTGCVLVSGTATGTLSNGAQILQNNYPYGPKLSGLKDGASIGVFGWRAYGTPLGGVPGADLASGFVGAGDRSAFWAGYTDGDQYPNQAGMMIRGHITPVGMIATVEAFRLRAPSATEHRLELGPPSGAGAGILRLRGSQAAYAVEPADNTCDLTVIDNGPGARTLRIRYRRGGVTYSGDITLV